MNPVGRRGEADSAFRFRCAWFSFKWALALGLGLGLLLALRPDVNRSPAPFLVMILYVGLPLGTATACVATLGFGISGLLARVFDERRGAHVTSPEPALPARTRYPRWLWAALGVLWLAGCLVAGFAPDTVLGDSPALRAYVSFMAPAANPNGLLGSRSQFPQVTLLYHAIVFWSFPAWLVVWWNAMNNLAGRDPSMLFRARLSMANRLGLLLLVPVWLALAYAALALDHGGDARLAPFGSVRMQLAIFGMASFAGGAAAVVAAVFSIGRVFRAAGPDRRER